MQRVLGDSHLLYVLKSYWHPLVRSGPRRADSSAWLTANRSGEIGKHLAGVRFTLQDASPSRLHAGFARQRDDRRRIRIGIPDVPGCARKVRMSSEGSTPGSTGSIAMINGGSWANAVNAVSPSGTTVTSKPEASKAAT
jgi:hypothetical protein